MNVLVENTRKEPAMLHKQPQRYSFFQAIRELEIASSDRPRVGEAISPQDESIRVGQLAELTFAPNTIDSATVNEEGHIEIDQRFFGLLGPSGPLPSHLTEIVRNRARHAGDDTLQSFIDMFHHRMAMLFYRSWSSSKPSVQRDRPNDDLFAKILGSLIGHGTSQSSHRDAWDDDTKLFFAGRLGSLHRNSEGLESILSHLLHAKVTVNPFALRWLTLAHQDKTKLDSRKSTRALTSNNALGTSAVLGKQVPDRQGMFEVTIGPMDYKTFENLLPQQPVRETVKSVINNYAGVGTDARVRLTIEREQVPQPTLGQLGHLGRNVWLHSRPLSSDRSDYYFEIDSNSQTNSSSHYPTTSEVPR